MYSFFRHPKQLELYIMPHVKTCDVRRIARCFVGFVLLTGGACKNTSPANEVSTVAISLKRAPSKTSTVLATVNGTPILLDDLKLQMTEAHSPREALHDLIQLELLAQDAISRGFIDHPVVVRELKRALANRYIDLNHNQPFTRERISADLIAHAYQANLRFYQRPEMFIVKHIVVLVRPDEPVSAHEAARKLATKAYEFARSGKLTVDEFTELGNMIIKEGASAGIRAKVEEIQTAREGMTVRPFAEAAFTLKNDGDISPVVATRYGYHVLYRKERRAPVNISLEEASNEIREKIFQDAKSIEFQRALTKLVENYPVEFFWDRLTEEALAASE